MKEESLFDHTAYPAKTLENGWFWIQYHDGSGDLKSPEGERSFQYDLTTYSGGVEYRKSRNDAWDIFWGTFDNFKEFAESNVRESETKKLGSKRIIHELRSKVSRDNRSLFDRAADEIERLQKENEELKNKRK